MKKLLKEILVELKEIKKSLQVIVSNKEQTNFQVLCKTDDIQDSDGNLRDPLALPMANPN